MLVWASRGLATAVVVLAFFIPRTWWAIAGALALCALSFWVAHRAGGHQPQ